MLPLLVAGAANSNLAKNKWTPVVIGVLVVGGCVVSYILVKKVLCGIGLATCRSDRKLAKLVDKFNDSDSLNPNYYQASQITMTHDLAKIKADEMYDALWGADDEDAVYSLMRSAKSKDNMSLISKYYGLRQGQSLADNLGYEMGSEEELKRMLEILRY
jgi:hypothetical protein